MDRKHQPMRELPFFPVSSWSGRSLLWVCLCKDVTSWGRRNLVIISSQTFPSHRRDLSVNCPVEFCPNTHLEAPWVSSHTCLPISSSLLPSTQPRGSGGFQNGHVPPCSVASCRVWIPSGSNPGIDDRLGCGDLSGQQRWYATVTVQS